MNSIEVIVHIVVILLMVCFIKAMLNVRAKIKVEDFDSAGRLPMWGKPFFNKASPVLIFLFALMLLDNVFHLAQDVLAALG